MFSFLVKVLRIVHCNMFLLSLTPELFFFLCFVLSISDKELQFGIMEPKCFYFQQLKHTCNYHGAIGVQFVQCVSQPCERKQAVCEAQTRFNLLDRCEHSAAAFLPRILTDWTFIFLFAICSCHDAWWAATRSWTDLEFSTTGKARTNEKRPWRLFPIGRIKTELNKKKKKKCDYLMKVACVCLNVCDCEFCAAKKVKCCFVLCCGNVLCVWLQLNVTVSFFFCFKCLFLYQCVAPPTRHIAPPTWRIFLLSLISCLLFVLSPTL